MVILTAKPGVTPDQIVKIMPAEIRATLKLYLDGTIRQYHLNQVCGGSAAFLFGRAHARSAPSWANGRRVVARQFPALADTRVAVGGACWALTVVFFVGQALAQAASTVPYSLWANYISDLGNTACGPFSLGSYHTDVCSPLSGLMNATFVVTGLLTSAGALGTWPAWPRRRLTTVGLILLVLAGAGEVLAGFQSENTNLALHTVGALFGIAGANLGVLLLGAGVWRVRRWAAVLSMAVGVVGLVSFALTSSAPSMSLGIGLVERVAAYPVTVWMIVVGAYLLWTARSLDLQPAT